MKFPPFPVRLCAPFLLSLLFLQASVPAALLPEHWVSTGTNGRLVYATDILGNRIPDFSNCGYEGGGVTLPSVPVKATVSPVLGDAGERIQAAINEVSKLPLDSKGFRGAILLRRGTYNVAGEIRIVADGVILRGEGQGDAGTRIVATGTTQRSLILLGSQDREKVRGDNIIRIPIADNYVPVGARSFLVGNTRALHVGDAVIVHRPSTEAWIRELGMDRIPQNNQNNVLQWKPGSKDLDFLRRITAIKGDTVSIDAPICCALDRAYGGGELLAGITQHAVRHVGVENLSGNSEYQNPVDEAHAWTFIKILSARDSWVRDVTSKHFGYSCVDVGKSASAITVQDCTCLDPVSIITGSRRYSFALDGQLTLVLRCHARNGRHDFVMHAVAAGPNAFVDCTAELAHSDTGPHHRWSVGVLYDGLVIRGAKDTRGSGAIDIVNRGALGTGHGWAGANQVLWNCTAESIKVDQPPTAQNWAIGCIAPIMEGNAYWESKGTPVLPRSLYRAQLEERLGKAVADAVLGRKG